MNFKEVYTSKIKKIDTYIEKYIDSVTDTQPVLNEAIKYSVLNGGKRLRSILCMEIAAINGVEDDVSYAFACAIEFIHAYSLVHDDLPSMDNDDFRRGKPSCHKKYGEAIAILVGDALLTLAFELMSTSVIESANPVLTAKAMEYVAKKAGMCGMINGQVIDINNASNKNADYKLLLELVDKKTSELIKSAVVAPVIISGADEGKIKLYTEFASNLGIAFQIRDDFEDISQDDNDEGSPNFINILGKDKAYATIREYINKTKLILNSIDNSDFLLQMHNYLFGNFE